MASIVDRAADNLERTRRAAALLEGGRAAEAVALCHAVLESDAPNPAALQVLGLALGRLGRHGEAVDALRRAVAAAPTSAACHAALGNACRKQGDLQGARAAFEEALRMDPRHGTARFNLALTLFDQGEVEAGLAMVAAVVRADPMDFEASQLLVDRLAEHVRAATAPAQTRQEGPQARQGPAWQLATVGFCSVDPAREKRARESLSRALGPTPHEFVVVNDARSLAEGFNRILDASRGDVVVLCHDDIEVISPGLDRWLAQALDSCDLVGVAGSDRVSGPAVLWSGHPHVHGWVSYPRDSGIEVAPLSLRGGLLGGMQALDGVLIAMRGATAAGLRFDAATFDGFHFYDLDFTYRAHRAGLRLAVSTDILLLHASEGRFGQDWQRYAQRFGAKFPELAGAQGKPHWYGARVDDEAQARVFYERLRALAI